MISLCPILTLILLLQLLLIRLICILRLRSFPATHTTPSSISDEIVNWLICILSCRRARCGGGEGGREEGVVVVVNLRGYSGVSFA